MVEHATEREEVAPSVEFLATRLFGRHVGDGADSGAGTGEEKSLGIAESRSVEAGVMIGEKLGEAKIQDFDAAAVGNENVGGLDVAMDDALFVGGVESIGKLDADFNGARNGKGAEGDGFVEGLAFEQLHGDEGAAILFFDGVNGANAGMIERGGRAGFAEETFEGLFVAMRGFRKKFQGDTAAELGVFSFVNDAHAAFAELAEDAVMGDGFVEHRQ